MSAPIPAAFYAPMKSPGHAIPSGDRTMARLLLKALAAAGFAPEVASELRAFDGEGDAAAQVRIRHAGEAEADRLIRLYRAAPADARPRLWFTYHVYYKAPDWIGPRVCEALAIPYAVAEGTRASKRAGGPWAIGHEGAQAALDRAACVFALTAADRVALERARPAGQVIVDLPPFVAPLPEQPERPERPGDPVRLLAVAMMRAGDKLASYRLLAEALALSTHPSWSLDIVGDGEARDEVGRLFAGLGDRVRFHGRVEDLARLVGFYAGADLFVWPAVNEAYGMVFLEAQAAGCPVVGGAYPGVASVVRDGETGLLARPGSAEDFARALGDLMTDPVRRRALGTQGRRFVRSERTLESAAARLRSALVPLLSHRHAA